MEDDGRRTGDGMRKDSSTLGDTQQQKSTLEVVIAEQEIQMALSLPENSPASHMTMGEDRDKGLHILSNGNMDELEHCQPLVIHNSQLSSLGKNTKPTFGKFGGASLELASKSPSPNEGNIQSKNDRTEVLCSENDTTLDMVAAQPLQCGTPSLEVGRPWSGGAKNWFLGDKKGETGEGSSNVVVNQGAVHEVVMMEDKDKGCNREQFEEEFPPLTTGRTKKLMMNFEIPQAAKAQTKETGSKNTKHDEETRREAGRGQLPHKENGRIPMAQQNTNLEGSSGSKPSMASMLKRNNDIPRHNEPVTFQPETIKKIGYVSISDGKPSIYFSGEDTHYLAEKMGRTVVGKFSHSIPSSFQIQNVLENMKFIGAFSWKYINAKHVAIRVENNTDYARLLVGENGVPVWFVDRHPMRVFRWTPDFNLYFETPIAAVWCNIVGLPIHLFEKSALFAIGGMLGTPIQIDHATAAQSRLSYARICVEIDISKPPIEEIIIDIMGREVVQKIIWDKIPLYCRECRHVGHTSSTCYANGKREKPLKRDYHHPRYNNPSKNYRFQPNQPATGGTDQGGRDSHKMDKGVESTVQMVSHELDGTNNQRPLKDGTREEDRAKHHGEGGWRSEEEGFRKQGRRRGRPPPAKVNYTILKRPNSTGDLTQNKSEEKPVGNKSEAGSGKAGEVSKLFAKPSYFKLLETGDFVMEDTEEGDGMEDEPIHSLLGGEDKIHPMEVGNNLTIMGSSEHTDKGGETSQTSIV